MKLGRPYLNEILQDFTGVSDESLTEAFVQLHRLCLLQSLGRPDVAAKEVPTRRFPTVSFFETFGEFTDQNIGSVSGLSIRRQNTAKLESYDKKGSRDGSAPIGHLGDSRPKRLT